MSREKFAVFDVDGTFFKSSCLEKVIDAAIAEKVFEHQAFEAAFRKRRQWQTHNNEGVYQSYLHSLVGGFVSQIVGVNVDRFDAVIARMVEEQRVRLFGFTRQLLELLSGDHITMAISGSPQMVVEPFLDDLGFDHIIGSQFGQEGGVYTTDITGTDKVGAFRTLAGENGVLDVAVGDTSGDNAIFELAERPIAFNPSATLRQAAIANRWPIVTENKDAVYQLIPTTDEYSVVFDRNPAHVLGLAG